MATTWQERAAARARDAAFKVALSGACGWCTDEGDEYRNAIFEYSRLDALTVARSGYLGAYAEAHANSKDIKKQLDVADFLAAPDSARSAGVPVNVDVGERDLAKREFFARRAGGVASMMELESFHSVRAAETEWMKRQAELETGVKRDDPNPMRKSEYRKAYRKRCRKDW